jgi:hypothetical protein
MHRINLETFHGEFKEENGWDPLRRTALLRKLHPIIKHRTYTGLGFSLFKDDFEEVMPPWRKKVFGGPYGFCAWLCLGAARVWAEQHHHHDPIKWVFEAGTKGRGQIEKLFDSLCADPVYRNKYRISGRPMFEDKELTPLQGADILAYELFKETKNQILEGGKRAVRLSVRDLIRRHEMPLFQFFGKARLVGLVERLAKKQGVL